MALKPESLLKSLQGRSDVGSNPKLQVSINRLSNQVNRLGGDANKVNSPGPVERVFDVLSRPNYAIAEGVDSALKGENPLSGAWRGLSGKDKTTFSDVIGDHTDIDGPAKAILGFAGDVLLDPTTYIGGGVVKGAGKMATEKYVAKGLQEAGVKAADGFNTFERLAQKKYLDEVKGLDDFKDTEELLNHVTSGKKVFKNAEERLKAEQVQERFNNYVIASYRDVAENLRAKAPDAELSKLKLTYGVGSKKASIDLQNSFISEQAAKFAELNKIKKIRQAFKTPTVDGGRVTELRTISEGKWRDIANTVIDDTRTFRDSLELTPEQNKKIFHALDTGAAYDDPKVIQAVNLLRAEWADMYKARAALDQKGLGKELENFLPRVFKKSTADRKELKKLTHGLREDGSSYATHKYSLAEAKKMGADPITDPWDLFARDRMDLAALQVHRNFEEELIKNYGFKAGGTEFFDDLSADQLKQFDDIGLSQVTLNDQARTKAYLPKQVAEAYDEIQKMWKAGKPNSDLGIFMDKTLNSWKGMVTVVNPSHHVRNIYGDLFLSYLGGVSNPKYWTKAAHINGNLRAAKRAKTVLAGHSFDSDDIYYRFKELGNKQGFFDVDAVEVADAQAKARFGPDALQGGLNKMIGKGREWGEGRETFTRLGHFIGVTEQEMKKLIKKGMDPKEAFDKATVTASRNTKKWLIDYGDLTAFEQGTAKKFLPFYTFMRKSFPLVLESMMFQPGKISAVSKAERAVNELLGNEPDNLDGVGRTVPKWVMDNGMPIFVNSGKEPVVLMPDLPLHTTLSHFERMFEGDPLSEQPGNLARGIGNTVTDALNPMLKLPIEIGKEESLFSGAPTDPLPEFLLKQVPLGGRAIKTGGAVKDVITGEGDKGDIGRELINFLTGSTQGISTERQEGELKRQQSALSEMLAQLKAERREGPTGR